MKFLYLALVVFFSSTRLHAADHPVVLDHTTKSQSTVNLLVSNNDTITFQITNTNPYCFTYNSRMPSKIEGEGKRSFRSTDTGTTVEISVTHQSNFTRYVLDIQKRNANGCQDDNRLDDYTFSVNVQTLGWAIDFSGAFYISDLVSSKYFLEPGKTSEGNDIFVVRRNSDVENSFARGLALLVHLYDGRKDLTKNIVWAPISFGIGINESTDYFVGTSLKFGDAMYLSLGALFADVDEIPVDLKKDGFTTNANALDTLGSKSDSGLFISFSYAFGGEAASARFTGLFPGTTGSDDSAEPTVR